MPKISGNRPKSKHPKFISGCTSDQCYRSYELVLFCRAAAMTLRTVLLSLQALLSAAEPDDPQDAVVAKQYKESPDVFRKTARHWASVYAGGQLYGLTNR